MIDDEVYEVLDGKEIPFNSVLSYCLNLYFEQGYSVNTLQMLAQRSSSLLEFRSQMTQFEQSFPDRQQRVKILDAFVNVLQYEDFSFIQDQRTQENIYGFNSQSTTISQSLGGIIDFYVCHGNYDENLLTTLGMFIGDSDFFAEEISDIVLETSVEKNTLQPLPRDVNEKMHERVKAYTFGRELSSFFNS